MALVIDRIGCQNRPAEYKGQPRIPAKWTYTTTDSLADLTSLGYFNKAYGLGMRDGDQVNCGYIDEVTGLPATVLGLIKEEGGHFTMEQIILTIQSEIIADDVPYVQDVEIDTGINIETYINSPLDNITMAFTFEKDGFTFGIKDTATGTFLQARDVRIVRTVSTNNSTQSLFLWVDGTTGNIFYLFTSDGGVITNQLYTATVTQVD